MPIEGRLRLLPAPCPSVLRNIDLRHHLWGNMKAMISEHLTYEDHIVIDPEILLGKPVVKGTRIPVELVLEYLARNPNFDDLFADYPRLTMEDVKACFAYAQALVVKRAKRPMVLPPVGSQHQR